MFRCFTPKPPTRSPLEPGSVSSRGRRGQGATTPSPFPPLLPPHSNTFPRRPLTLQDRTNMQSPEETGQGERETHVVQSAEGGKGKDRRERIIVAVRSPSQENDPADAQTSTHNSVLGSANRAWTRSVHLDAPGQQHGQQPVSGTSDPRVVKQDKSSRGFIDTTKTRSYPQRVGMHHGRSPIGAAKGKQTNNMASCQPRSPPVLPSQGVASGRKSKNTLEDSLVSQNDGMTRG